MKDHSTSKSALLAHMVLHPAETFRWLVDRLRRRSTLEQGVPWLPWTCIDWLGRNVKRGSSVFEWGAGGSTVFFAALGCEVTTVESNAEWVRLIEDNIRTQRPELTGRVHLRPVSITGDFSFVNPGDWNPRVHPRHAP